LRDHHRVPGRFPLLVFVVVAAVGWAWVAVGARPFPLEPDDACGRVLPETSSYSTDFALWPPGATRCAYTTPAESGTYTYVPWEAWLVVLGGAAGVALAAAGRPLVGIPLAFATLAVWFVV
jgi:hypothetical protein